MGKTLTTGVGGGFTAGIIRRYLRSRRGFTAVVTGFSVTGILLGVAALIIVLAVMSGFRQELMGRILGLTGHANLEVAELTTAAADLIAGNIIRLEGVESASPYVSGQVMLSANGKASGAFVRGIRPQDLPPAVTGTGPDGKPRLIKLAETDPLAPGTVLVGAGIAQQLGLVPGSGVTLLAPQGARTPFGFIPRTVQMTVGGIFTVGMVQFDSGFVLANLEDTQKFIGTPNRVQAIEVRVKNPATINTLAVPILNSAERITGDPLGLRLSTWETSNRDFFNALQVERVTMFIILSLIVLVAAFNIITGQMMLVNDKLADIAILRTMGATRRQVLSIFFFNGMLLGGMGTLGGLLVGLLAVWQMQPIVNFVQSLTGVNLFPGDVYFLSELPARVAWGDVGAVLAMALTLTLLASLYPAWRASRMDPVQLLKRG